MSTGHLRYEAKPKDEWLNILGERDTAQLKAKPVNLDTSCDIPYSGGISVDGKTVYIDRRFYKAIANRELAIKGMTPNQIVQAIIEHEHTEKAIMDGDNPVDTYPPAHGYAMTAEHEFVEMLGCNSGRYESALEPFIRRCLKQSIDNPPRDLWCGPILDDPTEEDKRILRELRAKGVDDASKVSKISVHYGIGAERCDECTMMQKPDKNLSKCDLVSGLVRNNRQCDRFEARSK